jgi:hypothetical protein
MVGCTVEVAFCGVKDDAGSALRSGVTVPLATHLVLAGSDRG